MVVMRKRIPMLDLRGRIRLLCASSHGDDVSSVDDIVLSLGDHVALLLVLIWHGKRTDRKGGSNDSGTHIEKDVLVWRDLFECLDSPCWIADPLMFWETTVDLALVC